MKNYLDYGEQELSDYWNKISALTVDSKKVIDNYVNTLQKQIGSDLSINQLDTIGTFIEKVVSNGGDVQKSIEYIETLFKDIKTPEDLTQALLDLNNISLDDENFVDLLTNKLSELGIKVNKNVVTQLNEATNAANNFNLSNITEQLTSKNSAYIDALKRSRDNDISFTDKEYEEYTKAFTNSGYDITEYFLQNDDGTYTLIKSWNDLIKVLYNTSDRVKEITQTTEDYNDTLEQRGKIQEIVNNLNKDWANAETAPATAKSLYDSLSDKSATFISTDFKELFKDLQTADTVEGIIEAITQNEQGELDYNKIAAFLQTTDLYKDDKEFLSSIPKELINAINNLSDEQKLNIKI